MSGAELHEVEERGKGIEEDTHEKHEVELPRGQVFVEHQEVVAEVQIDLPWALHREATAAHVVDEGGWCVHYLMPPCIHAPTEVYLLLVSEEMGV